MTENIRNLDSMVDLHASVDPNPAIVIEILAGFLPGSEEDSGIIWHVSVPVSAEQGKNQPRKAMRVARRSCRYALKAEMLGVAILLCSTAGK